MADTRFALALAAAVLVAPVAAYAASATYTFSGDGRVCGVEAPEGICAAPGVAYDLTGTRDNALAPTLSAIAAGTQGGSTDEGVNHFNIGLGVGASDGNASSRIGQLEDLVLTFGDTVQITSFDVAVFEGQAGLDQQGELVNGISELFDHGDGDASTTVTPEGVVVGTTFTWTNITPSTSPGDGFGYFLASVTVEFEEPDGIVPVPPALPLLGGALGLLLWRGRKAKTSA